jgi:hypothetical protein
MSDPGDTTTVITDEVFEKAEQEVMSFLPEMSEVELTALCTEIGLDVSPTTTGRKALYRLVINHLFQKETDDADGGKAAYVSIHGVLRQIGAGRAIQQHQ